MKYTYLKQEDLFDLLKKEVNKYTAEIKQIETLDSEHLQIHTNLDRDYNEEIDNTVQFISAAYKKHQEIFNLDLESLYVDIETSNYSSDPKRQYVLKDGGYDIILPEGKMPLRVGVRETFKMIIRNDIGSLSLYFKATYPEDKNIDRDRADEFMKIKLIDAHISYNALAKSQDSLRIVEFFNMMSKDNNDELTFHKWSGKFTNKLNKIRKAGLTNAYIKRKMRDSLLRDIRKNVLRENNIARAEVFKAIKKEAIAYPTKMQSKDLGRSHFVLSNRKVGENSYANPYALQILDRITLDELLAEKHNYSGNSKTVKCKVYFRRQKPYIWNDTHKICEYQQGVLDLDGYTLSRYLDKFLYDLHLSGRYSDETLRDITGVERIGLASFILEAVQPKKFINTNGPKWENHSTWFSLENNKKEKAIVEENFSEITETKVTHKKANKGWLDLVDIEGVSNKIEI